MKMLRGWIYIIIAFISLTSANAMAQDTIFVSNYETIADIGKKVQFLEDKNSQYNASEALNDAHFQKSTTDVLSLQITNSSFWVKFTIKNNTQLASLTLNIASPTIDSVTFYCIGSNGTLSQPFYNGEFLSVFNRHYQHQDYIFDLDVPPGTARSFLFRVRASEQLQLPMKIGSPLKVSEYIATKDFLFGLYAGIIMVMLLYNLFLYFTVRDRAYLFYVLYILFVGLSQACLEGYAPRFLYPDSSYLPNAMMVWVPALSGICSVLFVNNFMNIKLYSPGFYRVLNGILIGYVGIILLSFTGQYRFCTSLLQGLVIVLSATGYSVAIKISNKGYRPAIFFLIAFSIFIAGVVIFVLRNFNVLPHNAFTIYAMPAGSAIEVVLLSFALADKINLFRKEKEESQAKALQALKENERIISEQNVMLERKVGERTHELNLANKDLKIALKDLKDAESQLVESEKMASLGQLTAGIAHEINNPINFVTSNVRPLNRDVQILLETVDVMEQIIMQHAPAHHRDVVAHKEEIDFEYLKTEIDQLLVGIGDGASRTAEIVKGLRIFSRLDEDTLKKADVNEGMESTLIITNNMLHNLIKVDKQYGNLPLIDCYPGKLNQVFLNIISNAIYAIKKKFREKDGGILTISTRHDEQNVYIQIADNGTGMDELTKKRIFEPFFTTKEVGEGTGLGMSIAYNTIIKHNGQIQIESQINIGTSFTIILPIFQN